MTLQTLKTALQGHPLDQPLALDAQAIGSDEIMALLRDCLRIEGLTIAEPQIAPAPADIADRVTIAGVASLLEVDELDVEAEFSQGADGALQLRLTARLPGGWMFGDSFPNVAGYLSLDPLNYGYRESYLNVLDFANPTVVLTSIDDTNTDGDIAIELKRGLNFKAQLSL